MTVFSAIDCSSISELSKFFELLNIIIINYALDFEN